MIPFVDGRAYLGYNYTDIKNQLNMELTVLLYQNGYPPEWDEEVFEKVMEQAENFKKYADWYSVFLTTFFETFDRLWCSLLSKEIAYLLLWVIQ